MITNVDLLSKNRIPYRLFLKIAFSIFITETVILFVLSFMDPMSLYKDVFYDALLLTIILIPVLYLFFLRPMLRHISELKQTEEALQKSKAMYQSLVDSTDDSIYLVDREYKYLFMNKRHMLRLGFKDNDYLGKTYSDFHSLEETRDFTGKIDRVFQSGESIQYEYKSARDNRYFLRTLSPVKASDGTTVAVTVVSKHITERRRLEEELLALSLTDELTGLYNRRGFMTLAAQQIKIAERLNKEMILFSADLDNLKLINDTFGHKEGDNILREAANVLRETFRQSDIIARIGGDEFVVLVIESDRSTADILSERLKKNIDLQNKRQIRGYNLSLSTGISFYKPGEDVSIDEMMMQADKLMYEHKRQRQGFKSNAG